MSEKLMNKVAEELNGCPTKEEKLETLIFYGNQLQPLQSNKKIPENIVPGCISETYLTAKNENGKIIFEGDSASLLTKGYLFILINDFSGTEKSYIITNLEKEVRDFLASANIDTDLMPSRMNTIANLVKQMILLAKNS